MSIMVVGPRYAGGSYHLATDLTSSSHCGKPAPRQGWREIDDREANNSNGLHEACARNFVGTGYVTSAARTRATEP